MWSSLASSPIPKNSSITENIEATRSENILEKVSFRKVLKTIWKSSKGHLAIALKLPVRKAEFPQASITLVRQRWRKKFNLAFTHVLVH